MKSARFWQRYKLSKKARIKYERDGDWWVATCPPLLTYGIGDTRGNALRELLANMHDCWRAYSGARLGPLLKVDYAALRTIIVRQEPEVER